MTAEPNAPILVQAIPDLRVNEGSSFQQLDFNDFIQNPDDVTSEITFSAEVAGNQALPQGIIVSDTGLLMGVPGKGTASDVPYEVIITVDNGQAQLQANVNLYIVASAGVEEAEQEEELDDEALEGVDVEELLDDVTNETATQADINNEKRGVWEAVAKELQLPESEALFNREITYDDVYYLLGRFAHFVIWNADDMAAPGELKEITLKGVSEHFTVYDRGCCLVAVPKSLFDYNRTLTHGVDTAVAMANEAFERHWNIEFGGFDKLVSAAWVEMRCLMEDSQKELEVRHYQPTYHDYQLYSHIRGISL